MLEGLRALAKKKSEEVLSDPNASEVKKRLAKKIVPFYNDIDVIMESPKSVTIGTLFFLGYNHKEVDDIYDKLMKEINVKYKLINPDRINFSK